MQQFYYATEKITDERELSVCVNTRSGEVSRLSLQVCTSRGQSVALLQQEGLESRAVSLSLFRKEVNNV